MTVDEVLEQLRSAGLVVERLDLSGTLQRVPVEDDKPGRKSGWYVARELVTPSGRTLIVGAYGNWKQGDEVHKLRVGRDLDKADRAEVRRRQAEQQRQIEREREAVAREAAARAAEIWEKLPESGRCEYLDRKKVKAWGVRFSRGSLVVPVRGPDGALRGLQFIAPDGTKRFLTGTAKRGAFHLIGRVQAGQPVAVAEGYATAASVHEATGWPVAVAFDAGNLEPVVRALKDAYPDAAPIVVCGDDDRATRGNPGRRKAQAAARAVDGVAALPDFGEDGAGTDWNDLHVARGLAAVRAQLDQALAAWREMVWQRRLVRNGHGQLRPSLYNVITILEHHPAWRGVYRMDRFANRVLKVRQPPYGGGLGEVTDVDGAELAAWLGDPDHYGLSVGTGTALEAIEVVASRHGFHPVLEYLDGLQWDGEERLPHFLADLAGAPRDDYTRAVGMNWLISAVARVREPGCKVDHMVILEGPQGVGKSTFVRTLCGPEWFAEMLESPQNKDFYQILAGRWMVEIAELQAFSKADRNRIKQALSAQEDTYRPSYGRYARQFPRQCVFVGTTNDDTYLKDETGARRFYPVRCTEINLEALTYLRDQLWAEADARYRRGEPWWEFPPEAAAEQDARYDVDVWEEPILAWLDGHLERYPERMGQVTPSRPVSDVTTAEIMRWALGIETAKQSRQEQMRVGAIMRRLGWRRVRRRVEGVLCWVYERPASSVSRETAASVAQQPQHGPP